MTYRSPTKLKVRQVEYGWGEEMQAIEFTSEMAFHALTLQEKLNDEYPNKMLTDSCWETIISAMKNETMYILSPFWMELNNSIRELERRAGGKKR